MTTTDEEKARGCERWTPLVHRIHDGEAVSDADRLAVSEHSRSCARCAELQAELAGLHSLLVECLAEPLPASAHERFAETLEAERRRESEWEQAARLALRWARVAAVLLVVLGLAAVLSVPQPAEPASEPQSTADALLLGDTDAMVELALAGPGRPAQRPRGGGQ